MEEDRALETRVEYNRKAMAIARRFDYAARGGSDSELESNFSGGVSQSDYDFFERVMDYSGNWKKRTWRVNKAALVYYFERVNPQLSNMFLDADNAYRQNRDFVKSSSEVVSEGKEKTSQVRKGLPDDVLDRLCEDMKSRGSAIALASMGLLIGGVTFGLRPSEWKDVTFEDIEMAEEGTPTVTGRLVIINRKQTHGRSNGIRRIINFSLQKNIFLRILYVETVIREFKEQLGDDEGFRIFMNRAGSILRNSRKKCFPKAKKILTYYSCRHQFSANAKSAGMTDIEIAALMGHASTETAKSHYGKRRVGTYGGKGQEFRLQTSPDTETVQAVIALQRDTEHAARNTQGQR